MGDEVRHCARSTSALSTARVRASVARELVLELLADHSDDRRAAPRRRARSPTSWSPTPSRTGARRGDGTIELSCELVDDALVVRRARRGVRAAPSSRGHWSPRSVNGRGLAIVDALSSSWTVDRSDGTVVTALAAADLVDGRAGLAQGVDVVERADRQQPGGDRARRRHEGDRRAVAARLRLRELARTPIAGLGRKVTSVEVDGQVRGELVGRLAGSSRAARRWPGSSSSPCRARTPRSSSRS